MRTDDEREYGEQDGSDSSLEEEDKGGGSFASVITSTDDEGSDGEQGVTAAFQPLPMYPGWASQGVQDAALLFGHKAVANGPRGFYSQFKPKDDADEEYLSKIGRIAMDLR